MSGYERQPARGLETHFGELKAGDTIGDPDRLRGENGRPVTLVKEIEPGEYEFVHVTYMDIDGDIASRMRHKDQRIRLLSRTNPETGEEEFF